MWSSFIFSFCFGLRFWVDTLKFRGTLVVFIFNHRRITNLHCIACQGLGIYVLLWVWCEIQMVITFIVYFCFWLILKFGKCCSFRRSHFCCIVSVWFSWSKCNRKHSVQTFKLSSQLEWLEWFVSGFREIILVAFISIKFNAYLSWKATSVILPCKSYKNNLKFSFNLDVN